MPNFSSVDEILVSLPKRERILMDRLRSLVSECIPKATEKFYGDMTMVFYRRNRIICSIWSVPGKVTTLGFNQGNLMSNEDGALLAEGRKQVYVMYFKTMKDIDENQVRSLLFEAAMLDDSFSKKRK